MAKRGPKTAAGRAAVRQNAVTHGLLASSPVIVGHERPADWEEHSAALMESLQPIGRLETTLAELLISFLWRIRRVAAIESGAIAVTHEQIDDETLPLSSHGGACLRDLSSEARRARRGAEIMEGLASMAPDAPLSNEDVTSVLLVAVGDDEQNIPPAVTIDGEDVPFDDIAEWDAESLRQAIAAVADRIGAPLDEFTAWARGQARENATKCERTVAEARASQGRLHRRHALPEEQALEKIMRYESHLYRRMFQTLHELEALQSRRRGEPVSLARLQVHGLPGA